MKKLLGARASLLSARAASLRRGRLPELPHQQQRRGLGTSCAPLSPAVDKSSQFVVCGAGAGGLAVAARLGRKFGEGKLTVVEPAEVVYIEGHCTL
jgi:hypothetical protein